MGVLCVSQFMHARCDEPWMLALGIASVNDAVIILASSAVQSLPQSISSLA